MQLKKKSSVIEKRESTIIKREIGTIDAKKMKNNYLLTVMAALAANAANGIKSVFNPFEPKIGSGGVPKVKPSDWYRKEKKENENGKGKQEEEQVCCMRIPKTIKLGGNIIEVSYEKDLLANRDCFGEYHVKLFKIVLDKDNHIQQMEETLIHEILEAIISIYDINLEHEKLALLSVVLHQLIKDNPEIFKDEKT